MITVAIYVDGDVDVGAARAMDAYVGVVSDEVLGALVDVD